MESSYIDNTDPVIWIQFNEKGLIKTIEKDLGFTKGMGGFTCNFVTSLIVTRCMHLYYCQPHELLTKNDNW